MSLLKTLFGPSKEEVWRQLAKQVEGRFIKKREWVSLSDAVQITACDWIITLDTDTQGNATYTRLRAPYFKR